MNDIFNHPELEQPDGNEYLWRFIKPQFVDNFIQGELYFSQLTEFDDYYEAITPMHHLALSYMNRMHDREVPEDNGTYISLSNQLKKMSLGIELTMFLRNLKEITKESNEDVLWKSLANAIDDIENIHDKHIENQLKTHANCWFIGDFTESALMWSSYSEPGGIAFKIKFSDFKRLIQRYFELQEKFKGTLGIEKIIGGKVKYYHYRTDPEWISKLAEGVPSSFIKHSSFKQENEYRLVIQREKKIEDKSEKIFSPFIFLDYFDVILHPSATIEEFDSLKEKVKDSLRPRISFSELAYRLRNKSSSNV